MQNPYSPASGRLFFSREATFRELLEDEQQGQSDLLFGGRRCGKTRLLERLQEYLRGAIENELSADELWDQAIPDHGDEPLPVLQKPHWPVLLSLQGHDFTELGEVLEYLGEQIVDSEPPVESLDPPPSREGSTRDFGAWLKTLDSALAARGLGGLALLVDEVEELLERGKVLATGEGLGDRLLTFFRFLDDHALKTRIWFVLAGSERLERHRHPGDGSPPLNTVRRVRLLGLDYPGRRRMMTDPFVAAGRLPPPPEAQRIVDRLAAGNVWLLGRLLERLFEQRDWRPQQIDAVAEELLAEQCEVLERWTLALGGEESEARKVFKKVVAAGSMDALELRGPQSIGARQLLEYHALLHRPSPRVLELGPELFRRWAAYEGWVEKPFGERSVTTDTGMPPGHFHYDVALSWAAPQRVLAKQVADELRALDCRVFYDQDLGHALWGADLSRYLPEIYDREAELCVLLVSEDYSRRLWPMIEARAALAKAVREGWDAVVVVSLDGATLPEYPSEVRRLEVASGAGAEIVLEIKKGLEARRS